jgi:hypothetical protein
MFAVITIAAAAAAAAAVVTVARIRERSALFAPFLQTFQAYYTIENRLWEYEGKQN